MDEISDEQIAKRVQEGDAEAFGLLIERYQPKLDRYGGKFLADADDAADVIQDVFIKAYENIQSFDAARRFSPWIYRIAHNEFVNALKKRTANRTVFTFDIDTLLPQLSAPDTADSVALERDLRRVLDAHVSKLDPKYREPVVLYYLEGMEYKEIAEVLRIPVSTVGVRLARARAALQRLAKDDIDL